jgi:TolA-binding protein
VLPSKRDVRRLVRGLAAALALAVAASACAGGGAEQMLETARFEELQRNLSHARKLYREILEKHAGTPQADEARARLEAIGDGAGAPPGGSH